MQKFINYQNTYNDKSFHNLLKKEKKLKFTLNILKYTLFKNLKQ